MEIGSFVKVLTRGEDSFIVEVGDEPRIDSAVGAWLDSGMTRDSIIELTCVDGSMVKILASEVSSWFSSSPESRRAAFEFERAGMEEDKATKQALGIWEE